MGEAGPPAPLQNGSLIFSLFAVDIQKNLFRFRFIYFLRILLLHGGQVLGSGLLL